MLLIRGFEDLVQSLFLRGEVYGTTHLYSGQEAVAVGFASALEAATAWLRRTAATATPSRWEPTRRSLLAELLGRETGVNGGRAGSMNVTRPRARLLGCFGIVGGSIAAATGAGALAPRTTGGGRRRVLRRRHDEPGLLLRVPQLRQGLRAAGRPRLREQRLRRVHAVRGRHARRDPAHAPRSWA